MSEITTNPPAGTNAENNNSHLLQQMRDQLEAANKQAKAAEESRLAAEAKLTELERRDMDEKQRLAAELADAKKAAEDAARMRDEIGRYTNEFKKTYDSQLAAVPADKRPQIDAMLAGLPDSVDWPARLTFLNGAISLIGSPPTAAGTVTMPGGVTPPPTPTTPETPQTPAPLTPEQLERTSFSSIMEARRQQAR